MVTIADHAPPEFGMQVSPMTVVVAGCHGGAGTSTVARLLEPARDGGRRLPPPRWPGRLLLVTRGTPRGAYQAGLLLNQLRRQQVVPVALVVVGDGPAPEPRLATLRLHQLQAVVPEIVRLPYVPRWRYVDDPLGRELPARLLGPLQRLVIAIENPSRRKS